MNHDMSPKNEERVVAMLGLTAEDSELSGNCPSNEELAAFIDHGLHGEARESMLAHLNRCRSCYRHWLEVCSYLDAADQTQSEKEPVHHWFDRLLDKWVAMPVAALVMLSIIVALNLLPKTIDQQVNTGYEGLVSYNMAELEGVIQALPLPWNDSTFSFSSSQGTHPAKAFGSGVWVGHYELSGANEPLPQSLFSPPTGKPWGDTQWADYYTAGRWSVLLWALVTTKLATEEDWGQQRDMLESLVSRFEKRPSTEPEAARVIAALANIKPLLKSMDTNSDDRMRVKLRRQLEIMMQQVAPKP